MNIVKTFMEFLAGEPPRIYGLTVEDYRRLQQEESECILKALQEEQELLNEL